MKKDKRIIQSEKAIIEASIQTLIRNPSAGMSEIATAAGVGRATLYRHFESREALIEKLILVCLEELEAASEPIQHLSGRAAIEAYTEVIMPLADRFHFLTSLWTIVADREAIKQIDNQLIDEMAMLVEQAKEAGEIDPKLPTMWLITLYDAILTAAWWLIASGDVTTEEATIYAKRSFFGGCTA